jgi:hypothetical protein
MGDNAMMMLALSVVLGIVPLAAVIWTLTNGMITTVDGLFLTLILLTISGAFMLNVYWELRDRGVVGKKKAVAAPPKTPTAKAS